MRTKLNKRLPCPCCGTLALSEPGAYEICQICGWEDDPVQAADPKYKGGANRLSLAEARKLWLNRKGQ